MAGVLDHHSSLRIETSARDWLVPFTTVKGAVVIVLARCWCNPAVAGRHRAFPWRCSPSVAS